MLERKTGNIVVVSSVDGNAQRNASEEQRTDKVMFIITTDGMENASSEYTYEKIKNMIERQKGR